MVDLANQLFNLHAALLAQRIQLALLPQLAIARVVLLQVQHRSMVTQRLHCNKIARLQPLGDQCGLLRVFLKVATGGFERRDRRGHLVQLALQRGAE